jgi:nickel-dependent lactate racemase
MTTQHSALSTQHSDYSVPYGRGELRFRLPPGVRGTVVDPPTLPPLADVPAAVAAALAAPHGPRLRDLPAVRPRATAVIVVTDATRACPHHLLVPPLLDELNAGGIPDSAITVLIGLGMHRASTPEERAEKLGPAVLGRVRVVDHVAEDPATLAHLGTTEGALPVPVVVNRLVVEADVVLATGIVEPHQYAGYSGGRKTVAIGAAGAPTIAATHGPRFLDHPGTRLGNLAGNPFHEAVSEIARRAGLSFILNVVCDGEQRVVAVEAGAPEPAFAALAALAGRIYTVAVPHAYDLAIGGAGWPKDTNLYQASRAASYLFFAPRPVVRPGGAFIIPAPCEEGAGQGVGERNFFKAMRDAPSIDWILGDARRNGYPPGQQRAFVLARVLAENPIIIVGAQQPEVIRQAHLRTAPTMESALADAIALLGPRPAAAPPLEVLIVPHALLTLPVVTAEA